MGWLALLFVLLLPVMARAQTPPGTVIDNTALATYTVGAAVGLLSPSNTLSITTGVTPTASTVEFMRYAPGATPHSVGPAECSATGLPTGPFGAVAPPATLSGAAIPVPGSIDLVAETEYPLGEAVFFRLQDADQNRDPAAVETVIVRLSAATSGDSELVRLSETGPDTGVFVGYIQSIDAPAAANDCALQAVRGADIRADYVDPLDPGDTATDTALISPQSRVFDSDTGGAVSGALVTLIDDSSGLPAVVFGDDGVSLFPASVPSGGSVTDAGGTVYSFAPGAYRFPLVPAGTYRIDVTPPVDFVYPSSSPTSTLQGLPGAPFAIVTGSRGEPFTLGSASAIRVDLPLDPLTESLFLTKTTSTEVVDRGEFVQYNIRVRNPGVSTAPAGMRVTDVLPIGFRYQAGSSRMDGIPVADPTVSSDGRTLTFTLGTVPLPQNQNISYVVQVTTGASLGPAINSALSEVVGGAESHTAHATVLVREDLFGDKTFLVGQVVVASCDQQLTNNLEGLPGVRLYLEDGTYVTTDPRGLFQFEGLEHGVHVVQMDLATLPPKYEPIPCQSNTRFAGRSFSQFVDAQRGTLWRTDFHVGLREPARGYVDVELDSRREEQEIVYTFRLNGGGVPVRRLRGIVQLPEGTRYVAGSSRLNGESLADPSVSEGLLTYHLGSSNGGWSRDVELRAKLPEGSTDGLEARAFALFDTPTKTGARTPVSANSAASGRRSYGEVQIVEITGLRPGEAWESGESEPTGEVTSPVHDRAWLEGQGPELEWLEPSSGFAPKIPSVHIAVKHDPQIRPVLLHNGEKVNPLSYEGFIRNPSRSAAISRWRGVDLVEGTNRFEFLAEGPDGEVAGRLERVLHYPGPPVSVELVPELSNPVADGRHAPVIALRFRDRFRMPVRQGVTGTLHVEAPYEPWQEHRALQERQLAGLAPDKPSYVVGKDGIALVRLKPTSRSGSVLVRLALNAGQEQEVRAWLEPENREWILVGLAEGTMGYNHFTGNEQAAEAANLDERLYFDDRIALFAKGRVRGDTLLTLAYDSRGREEPLGESLKQIIDPDRYYSLYGSESQQDYDAATANKLYVKVERKRFYALFGDYDTALDATELARYSRSFTGVKSEYQGDRFSFSAFATETDHGFLRDEIQGDGTSGLYRLTRDDLVRNSETVTLETRDRFQTEIIKSSETLTRHVDYNIDYDLGTLFFKRPIPSKTAELDPVFIVVTYETEDDENDALIAGGRGAVKFLDGRIELGASAIHEGTIGQDGELLGVDLRFEPHVTTELRAEIARSESQDGLLEKDGSAFLAELKTQTERVDARAFYRREGSEFGLGFQNQSELGMRKFGAEARLRVDEGLQLVADGYRQTNLDTDADRDVLEGRADYQKQKVQLFGGFRLARDRFEGSEDRLSRQLIGGGSYAAWADRLRLQLSSEISLGGANENTDFPSRLIAGAEFDLIPQLTVFAQQEFAFGDDIIAHGTRTGLRSSPWKGGHVSSSFEQQMTEHGARTFANLGLSQAWQVTDRWGIDLTLDRTQTLRRPDPPFVNPDTPPTSGTLDDDFTALSLGSTLRGERWSWTARIETRVGEQENKWTLFSGLYKEVSEGIGYSLSLHLGSADPDDGAGRTEGNLRLGFVYRPLGTRWILLDRLDLAFDEQRGGAFEFRNRKWVNNLHLNYQWTHRVQVSLQYGAKYLLDTIDGSAYRGYTDLLGVEIRRDLGSRWDIGGALRVRSSWHADVREPSYGIWLGYQVATNLWVSAGYNFAGFRDEDFSSADYTSEGPFVRFRYKFDQDTIGDLLDREW